MGIKSKIHNELAKAAGIAPGDGESITDQDYLKKLTRAVASLPDATWNKLSDDAGDFHNKLADALNSKKPMPEYPDAEKTADEEEAPKRRRRAAEEEEEEAPKASSKKYEPKKGDKVRLVTVKGKSYIGTVTNPDDDGELVIDTGEDEFGFTAAKIDTVELAEPPAEEEAPKRRRRAAEEEEPEEPAGPEVGDTVEVTNKRGNVKVGNILKITEDELVIKDAAGDEFDYDRARVDKIVIKVKNAGKGKATSKAKADGADEKGTKTTKDDNGGVAVTMRIREIMCEEPLEPLDLAALTKRIAKEGLVCKDNTLKMVHTDCLKIFGLLKAAKRLK